jgi:acyl carrier protein
MDMLIALFAECLNVPDERLTEDSSPDTIAEWDSLAAMALVAAIEEQFDIRLSTREIMSMRTIAITREVLKRKGVSEI